ncbi:MAG: hypothetical protein WAK93_20210 [Solirubrobacteraceae bacterium]
MHAGFAPRCARGSLVAAICAAAAAVSASPAIAATVSASTPTATPEQAVPVQLSFSGTADPPSNSNLDVVVRPAGGLPCQATYESDQSAAGPVNTTIFGPADQSVAPGSYQLSASYKPPQPGSYQVCAWLEQPAMANASADVAGPATLTFSARGPVASELSISVPAAPQPNVAFDIDYGTQTDQQLNLYSVIAKAGNQACASSYELERQQGQVVSTVFGFGQQQVFGGPTTTPATVKLGTGSYLVCGWIEGPNGGEVDLATSKPLTVGTPSLPPGLHLGKVTASRRHGVSVSGTTAAGLSGRLVVTAACGASSKRATPKAGHGRFRAHLALPGGCRRASALKVGVSWGGSSAFAKQSTSKRIAIKH